MCLALLYIYYIFDVKRWLVSCSDRPQVLAFEEEIVSASFSCRMTEPLCWWAS